MMGQYYQIVNVDKQQYLCPHDFGDGLKLLEFGSGGLTMTALAVLLAEGNGRGGGDLHLPEGADRKGLVGSWARDRVVIAGDYADPEKGGKDDDDNLYHRAGDGESYTNVSADILDLLMYDEYLAGQVFDQIRNDLKGNHYWALNAKVLAKLLGRGWGGLVVALKGQKGAAKLRAWIRKAGKSA